MMMKPTDAMPPSRFPQASCCRSETSRHCCSADSGFRLFLTALSCLHFVCFVPNCVVFFFCLYQTICAASRTGGPLPEGVSVPRFSAS